MGFLADSASAARSIITALGQTVSYQPTDGDAVSTVAVVETDVELVPVGLQATVSDPQTVITVLDADVSAPMRGEIITDAAANVWQIDSVVDGDGVTTRLAVFTPTLLELVDNLGANLIDDLGDFLVGTVQ